MDPERPHYRKLDDLTFHSMLAVLQGGMWLLNDIEGFLKPFGMSHGRFSILLTLLKTSDGKALPVEISRVLGKSKPTVTRLIERLEKDGYIRTRKDASDGRSKQLSLTERGVDILDRIVPAYNERLERMSSSLSRRDKQTIILMIGKINFLDDYRRIGGCA